MLRVQVQSVFHARKWPIITMKRQKQNKIIILDCLFISDQGMYCILSLRCTDICSHGHSFPHDFWQGRTFVLTPNDHPWHPCLHQMTTPDIRSHIKLPPGHSFTWLFSSLIMYSNLYNSLFDELIPRWVKETWQWVSRNIWWYVYEC